MFDIVRKINHRIRIKSIPMRTLGFSLLVAFFLGACKGDSETPAKNNFLAGNSSKCMSTASVKDDPNYQSGALIRSDIRGDEDGLFMHYKIRVVDVNNRCRPVPYALVEIWQTNDEGDYSKTATDSLRGMQHVNSFGEVQFMSVFPGWHEEALKGRNLPRTHHVNLKISLNEKPLLMTEFYFADKNLSEFNQYILPYRDKQEVQLQQNGETITLQRPAQNADDPVYRNIVEQALVMNLERVKQGYAGNITIGVAL